MKLNLVEIFISDVGEKSNAFTTRFDFLNKNLASDRQKNKETMVFKDGNIYYVINKAKNFPGKWYVKYKIGELKNDNIPLRVLNLVDDKSEAIQKIKDFINKKENSSTKKTELINKITDKIQDCDIIKLQKIINLLN